MLSAIKTTITRVLKEVTRHAHVVVTRGGQEPEDMSLWLLVLRRLRSKVVLVVAVLPTVLSDARYMLLADGVRP